MGSDPVKGDREHLHRILTDLNMRAGQYFVGGSGPLALRGIRCAGDLDIGVTTAYWFELELDPDWRLVTPDPSDAKQACDPPYLEQIVHGLPVHVFSSWRQRPYQKPDTHDFNQIFREHIEDVDGWPCLALDILLRQKVETVRPKDMADIAVIANALFALSQGGKPSGPL